MIRPMLQPDEIQVSFVDGEVVVYCPGLVAAGETFADAVAELRELWAARGHDPDELQQALEPSDEWIAARLARTS